MRRKGYVVAGLLVLLAAFLLWDHAKDNAKPAFIVYQTAKDVPPFALGAEWFNVQHWLDQQEKGQGTIVNVADWGTDDIRAIPAVSEAHADRCLSLRYQNKSPRFDLFGYWSAEPRRIMAISYTTFPTWKYNDQHLYQFYAAGRALFSYGYRFNRRYRTRLDWQILSRARDVDVSQYFTREGGLAGYHVYYNSRKWPNSYVWNGEPLEKDDYNVKWRALDASRPKEYEGPIGKGTPLE
jgi:hypothetical protein